MYVIRSPSRLDVTMEAAVFLRHVLVLISFLIAGSPVAAAVASSPSHLATGRTASGVLENCIEACLNTLGSFVGGAVTG